jgi:hypothetical protein
MTIRYLSLEHNLRGFSPSSDVMSLHSLQFDADA